MEANVCPVLQAYVPPPLPVNVAVELGQILRSGPALATGKGLTVTIISSVPLQPPDETVTVKVVVVIGVTFIDAEVEELFHKYVPPPDAVRVVLCPTQIV
jgi:hypothetical protein